MSLILLPGRSRSQPQRIAPIDIGNPIASGLVSALVFDSAPALDRVTGRRHTVTNAVITEDRPGRVLYFDGSGDYVNLGAQTVGGVNLFADSNTRWSAVVACRFEGFNVGGTVLAKCGASGPTRTFHIFRDTGFAVKDPSIILRGSENLLDWDYSTPDWHQYTVTWDGSTAMAYGDYGKSAVLSVGTASQESENIVFGARTGGSGFLLTGRIAYGYFFNRAISRAESISLYDNPWQLFLAPPRRIFSLPPVGGGGAYTLTATPAAFAATTYPATLRVTRKLATSPGAYAMGGQPAALRVTRKLVTSTQAYHMTPQAARLARRYVLSPTSTAFSMTGHAAVLRATRRLVCDTGAWHMTARSANLVYSAAPPATVTGGLYPWYRRRRR